MLAESTASEVLCRLVAHGVGLALVDPFTASAVRDPAVVIRCFRPRVDYAAALVFPAGVPRSRAVEGPPTAAGTLTGMDPDDLRPASHKARHPHRKIKLYRVQRGDTPGSIAVRYHAWTDQLIAINHTSTLYVGQVIRIPVVVKASRKCKRHENHFTGYLADNRSDTAGYAQYQGTFGRNELQVSVRRDRNQQYGGHDTGALAWG